jgi:hypothetical protein
MVSLAALWLPILLSAVVVFLASFVLHMVLPIHRADYRRLPREDEVMAALRPFAIPPGDYMVPCAGGPKDLSSPEFKARLNQGPVAVMTVMKNGPFNMGRSLLQWFIYCLVIGVFAAYIASRATGADASRIQVVRFAGATAFAGYALAMWQDSIWYQRNWGTTLRYNVDGLIYALLTAACFGWLWPH